MFGFAIEHAVIFDFNRVEPVRIKTKNGNTACSANIFIRHRIANFLTVLLWDDPHRSIFHDIAAAADNGCQRSNAVGIDHDFADIALRHVGNFGTGRSACRHGGKGKRRRKKCGTHEHGCTSGMEVQLHLDFSELFRTRREVIAKR